MKKYSHIINIAMVIVGIVGMLFYFSEKKPTVTAPSSIQVLQEKEPVVPTETITVAVANRELGKGSRLTANDFKLKTITITQGSKEKTTLAIEKSIDSWLVKSDIAVDSYIPISALVAPGTEEYISMSLKPGHIIYGFSIRNTDSYLFTNVAAGDDVDVYLLYQLRENVSGDGSVSVTPTTETSNAINSRHFKLIMKNKKVLAINTNEQRAVDAVAATNPLKKEGYVLLELTQDEVKTLKGLDGARLYIFPGEQDAQNLGISHSALVGAEGQWPIDNRDILSTANSIKNKVQEEKIKEFRGAK